MASCTPTPTETVFSSSVSTSLEIRTVYTIIPGETPDLSVTTSLEPTCVGGYKGPSTDIGACSRVSTITHVYTITPSAQEPVTTAYTTTITHLDTVAVPVNTLFVTICVDPPSNPDPPAGGGGSTAAVVPAVTFTPTPTAVPTTLASLIESTAVGGSVVRSTAFLTTVYTITPTRTANTAFPAPTSTGSASSVKAVIGGVVGGFAVVVALFLFFTWQIRRKKNKDVGEIDWSPGKEGLAGGTHTHQDDLDNLGVIDPFQGGRVYQHNQTLPMPIPPNISAPAGLYAPPEPAPASSPSASLAHHVTPSLTSHDGSHDYFGSQSPWSHDPSHGAASPSSDYQHSQQQHPSRPSVRPSSSEQHYVHPKLAAEAARRAGAGISRPSSAGPSASASVPLRPPSPVQSLGSEHALAPAPAPSLAPVLMSPTEWTAPSSSAAETADEQRQSIIEKLEADDEELNSEDELPPPYMIHT